MFHQHKKYLSINNIYINKAVVSNTFPFGKQTFKYFNGYKDDKKIRPFCIFHTTMTMQKEEILIKLNSCIIKDK